MSLLTFQHRLERIIILSPRTGDVSKLKMLGFIVIHAFSFYQIRSYNNKAIDGSAKGGLTQFWELFTMIPCTPKYLKR